jgi:hypothetical protein
VRHPQVEVHEVIKIMLVVFLLQLAGRAAALLAVQTPQVPG